jgi:probable F420-dependent oxidoreductase
MKFGILPTFDRRTTLDPDWVLAFARMAEAGGAESIWAVEHVVVAKDYEPLYPYSPDGRMPTGPDTVMPDPLEWLAFVAAGTSRLRLGTSVVVAAEHSAAILAKRVATLDALSRGRVLLGVGIGWQKEEYAAIGVPYRDRGRRLDETIEAMRALWGPGPASYRGRHVAFENVSCDAKPAQKRGVPILIGGSSPAAARRAGRLGDGFYPYVISPEDLAARLAELREAAREAGRDPAAIEVTVWPGSFAFDRTFDLDLVRRYVDCGGVARLVVSALEAGGTGFDDQRRLVDDYREKVIEKLA